MARPAGRSIGINGELEEGGRNGGGEKEGIIPREPGRTPEKRRDCMRRARQEEGNEFA